MNKLYLCFLCIFFLPNAYSEENTLNEVASWKKATSTKKITTISKNSEEKIEEPGYSIKTQNPYLGYVYIDYLYWSTKRTGMFYELGKAKFDSVNHIGSPKEIKMKWSSGFRVDAGFSNIYDWMIGGVFTYYANRLHHKRGLSPTDLSIYNPGHIFDSQTSFRLRYWTADLDFSTLFNFSSSATLKPFITARVGHFRYHIHYFANTYNDTSHPSAEANIDIYLPYTFTGIGPRAGFNAYYKCGKTGLNFFGSFSGSLLYGKVKYQDYRLVQFQSGFYDPIFYAASFKDLKASMQLLLGAEWKAFFDHDKKAIMLRTSWETNYWWDLVDYYNRVEAPMNKSLILYGANFGIGLEY